MSGLPQIDITGRGGYKPPVSQQLDVQCSPGDIVHWESLDGEKFIGELLRWNANIATINTGSTIKLVAC